MDRRILLAAVGFVAAATGASAADLAVQSPLGALFAEPAAAPAAVYVAPTQGYPAIYAPPVDIRPLVAGYYGKPNSYIYSPYYGDSLYWNFARLPYACGFHGYC
ncbi:MAG: hypothetical protein QOH32_1882 [Bradyrhizobium sp.]|jgi:hypothetical protein|nr:hypothetical protein [Bradyrhizobium sp.]